MSDLNNIVSEFIYIPELMGKEISKLIKNKQKQKMAKELLNCQNLL